MIQQIIIVLLFAGALLFLGRMIWRSFLAKKPHEPGCAKCVPTDKVQRAS